ncbi:MAG TPA: hypothetical protein VJL84_06895 [Kiloniellales bacterium]|nr:hypothetical protein [Kiloniellales bacterium]
MIYYVCHPGHCYTVAVVLLYHGERLRDLLRLVPYGKLTPLREAGAGVVIWTDFDRLDPDELREAGAFRAELEATRPDLLHLNDPRSSEQRFALLRRLYDEGTNAFDVRRPDQPLDGLRYPVFLRDEVGASSAAPTLLHDRSTLEAAIAALPGSGLRRPMIVEFGSRPGPDGYYRKYGAYRVGTQIFPQHCFAQQHWFIKHSQLRPEHRAEHIAYVLGNPHRAELLPLFEAAKITFGRIDYTLVDGRIQVFEINTNPAVLAEPPTWLQPYDQRPYARHYVEALLALPQARRVHRQEELDRRHRRLLRRLRGDFRRKRWKLTLERAKRRYLGR